MLVRIALLLERMLWCLLLLLLLLKRMVLWMLQRMLKWIVVVLGRQLHHLGHCLRSASVDAGRVGHYRWWLRNGCSLHGQRWWWWWCLGRWLWWLQIPGGCVGDTVIAHTGQQLALLGDVVVTDATQSAQIRIVVGMSMGKGVGLPLLLLLLLLLLLMVNVGRRRRRKFVVLGKVEQTYPHRGVAEAPFHAAHGDAHDGAGGGCP